MEDTMYITKKNETKQNVSQEIMEQMDGRTSTFRENPGFRFDPNDVSDSEMNELENKAKGLARVDWRKKGDVYSVKVCPTRHGCSGATDCDNSYGDYHR